MKNLILISLFMALSALPVLAQEKTENANAPQEKSLQTDDKKAVDDQNNQPAQRMRGQKHKFIDENGDGVDDNAPNGRMKMRMGAKGNGKGKGMDNFVDKDGDGINDNRACGMGWEAKGRKGGLGRHGGGGGK